MKVKTFIVLLTMLICSCRATILDLCYPKCVKIVKQKRQLRQLHFSTSERNRISKLNYVPSIHNMYQRYHLRVKSALVSLSVLSLKENKVFRAKIARLMVDACRFYVPRLRYLDMARHLVRYVASKGLISIQLVAAYEIMRELADSQRRWGLSWELDRFQVVSTIEECGRKQRQSNMVLVYNTDMTRGKVISLSGKLSLSKDRLLHLEYKIARKVLIDLFYPATRIVFNWNVVAYFNSTSAYLHKRQVEESLRPKFSRCTFSFPDGEQRCE